MVKHNNSNFSQVRLASKRQRLSIASCLLVIGVITSGCGSSDDSEASNEPIDVGVELPQALSEGGTLRIGVRCDYPGRGYLDETGDNAGLEPEMAREFANYAFGDPEKVDLTCVTAENRISQLTSNRVDMLIASLGWTEERAEVVDFSEPYIASVGTALTTVDVPDDETEQFLEAETVLAVTGTPYSDYVDECIPDASANNYQALSDAVSDLLNERGGAIIHDDTSILELAEQNSDLKVNGPDLDIGMWTGVGLRQNDTETTEWVNAVLADMQEEDKFYELLDETQEDGGTKDAQMKWIKRPDQDPDYSLLTGKPEC